MNCLSKVLIILSIFILACSPDPDFTTSQGIENFLVDDLPITIDDVDAAAEYYAIRMAELIPDLTERRVRKSLKWLIIRWYADPIPCWNNKGGEWHQGLCNGTMYYENLEVWYKDSNLANTAFFFEITRWIMYREGVKAWDGYEDNIYWEANKQIEEEYRWQL